MRGAAGRIGVAGVHLEALAPASTSGEVAVADRSGGTACTLAVALDAALRRRQGRSWCVDVAMAVTGGLDDVERGSVGA